MIGSDLGNIFGPIQNTQPQSQTSNTDSIICGDVPQSCEGNEYRTYDGTCNNLKHSWYGAANQVYTRKLPASYSDGVHAFPISETNASLPNARTVSMRSYVDVDVPDILWNILFMQYGQIVAHDMSLTAGVPQTKKSTITCCAAGQVTVDAKTNPRCAPIEIPADDPYNAPEGIKCTDFIRTQTTSDFKCTGTTQVEEQINAVTAYLDISYLYGSNNLTAKLVRAFEGGFLKFDVRKGKMLLPQDPQPLFTCDVDVPTETCFFSGDVRVNQNPQLAILQNIYLAQHNNIAKALASVNPHWKDERIFQETRKIMIGKHQHIIYTEFLPPLIGKQNMIDNKLLYLDSTGYNRDYDPNINAAASNEYATAAFRGFHTEIQGLLRLYQENRRENDTMTIRMSNWFHKPSICEQGRNFNKLVRGMTTQAQSSIDRFHTNEILNFLFVGKNLFGMDLKTTDIQRGRDHGIGSYVQALKLFGIADIKTFKDFEQLMPKGLVDILGDLYRTVNDVDLNVGLSFEPRMLTSLSGRTIQAILIEQFKRTRVGDRCFYENGEGKCAFTLDQLTEIRKSTIAEFMCNNPGTKNIQKEAFKLVSALNPVRPCSEVTHKFDPTPWKEQQ